MVAAASNTRALDRGAGLHRGRAALTHPSLPHAPAAMSQEGKAQGWGRNGKCRSVQNRSSGETRWRGSGGKSGASCSRQGQGLGSCWESKPRDINTSKGRGSASASMVSRAPSLPQPPQHLGLQSPPKPGKAPVAGGTSPSQPCTALHPAAAPCPDFPRREVPGCSQAKHGAFPGPCPTAQKRGDGRPAHIPVAKTLRMSQPLGCWGVPLSLTSPGLTKRNQKKHK